MAAYIVRRAAFAASLVIGVSFGAFVVFGTALDPAYQLALSPDKTRLHELQREFHLKDPILERYALWARDVVTHRSFGKTVMCCATARNFRLTTDRAIGPAIWSAAAVSAQLIGVSMVLVILVSAAIGSVGARWPGSLADGALRIGAYLAWSTPTFLIGFFLAR